MAIRHCVLLMMLVDAVASLAVGESPATRRRCLQAVAALNVGVARAEDAELLTSASGDFEFRYPATYAIKSKPVKTHLEEVIVKSGKRQIGVVVDPIKIDSLEDFGSPEFVGNRVVQAEKRRDGVTDATLLDARRLADGTYRIDYTNQSTRGDTRYLSRIAVANGRLYVMTCQAKIDDFAVAESGLRLGLDSFVVRKR